MVEIAVSVITGVLTLIGVCVTAWTGAKKTRDDVSAKLATAQAVTDCKIEALTREVRMHNDFARRVPVLEEKVKAANGRIADLERKSEQKGRSMTAQENEGGFLC